MSRLANLFLALMCSSPVVAQDQAYITQFWTGDRLYTVDLNSGQTFPVGSYRNNGLTEPRGLAWRPDTQELWTIDRPTGRIGVLHHLTAIFLPRATLGPADWSAIAWEPVSARLYMLGGGQPSPTILYSFNPANNAYTPIGRVTTVSYCWCLAADGRGNLWAVDQLSQAMVLINPANASSQRIGATVPLVSALGINTLTGTFYAATEGYSPSLYQLDPATGVGVLRGGLGFSPATGLGIVESACRADFRAFGAGCAGSGGIVPNLDAYGCFGPGGDFILRLRNASGTGTAFLFFGLGSSPLPLGNGCGLLLSPLLGSPMAVPLLGAPGPGAGFANLTLHAPPTFAPGAFAIQSFILDAGANGGFAASNGVSIAVF